MTQKLVRTLTAEERELAAQGSFAYWVASISNDKPTDAERWRMATREARRFLGNPYDVAEVNLKQACKFRKVRFFVCDRGNECRCLKTFSRSISFQERRIDLIRSCFMYGIEYETDEEEDLAAKIRHQISSDLLKQKGYVRGRDKDGRALLILHSRTQVGTVEEEFVLSMIYLMERAIAYTEFDSEGEKEKITAVFDFGSFNASLAPSTDALKRVSSILQNTYSERLQKLVIIDPAFWMRTAWGIFKPFLHPVTRAKFVMAAGIKGKTVIIGEIIEASEAMPFLLPTGQLHDEVFIDIFTKNVPFQCGYDRIFAECTPCKLADVSVTTDSTEEEEASGEWSEVWI